MVRGWIPGLILLASLRGLAQAQAPMPAPLPSFAELEAAGATIGEIRVTAQDIFDTSDPKEDKWLFRWANRLHIQTRPDVIERALLFKSGERVSQRLIDETERLLRSNRYLYEVQLRPVAYHDGVVDIEVQTRDTWSLDPGVSAGRTGGTNSSGIHLKEHNVLGTGTSVNLSHATNSDGKRDALAVVRPFYALDSRWSAGLTASKDDRIDAIYNTGTVASQYRHRQKLTEVFAGWSPGLVDGWVQRYSLGLSQQTDAYLVEPGLSAPARLPGDEKLVTPFVRLALIEDRYDRELNRNLVGRPEFFALGLAATVQLGRASTRLGSSLDAVVYAATISRGFEPFADHTLMAAANISGQYTDGQVRRQRVGAQTQYYLPQSPNWLFFASAAGDVLTHPDPSDSLLLGGDSGLRGFPLRYQSGTRRALFTAEERFYTDLYVWRLFRIGGAAFFDAGRAWGGDNANTLNPGWLADAGFGLRIVSARAAFSNVLHVDIAFPLKATADVKKVQFLVKTKASF